jgi:xylose isomerase
MTRESNHEYFEGIGKIPFEGLDSKSELAFRYYDKNRLVLGRPMQEHLRFAVCFWHTFCWNGTDVFGHGTFGRPWLEATQDAEAAARKRQVAFEFFSKLGVPFYCFHDVDVMPAVSSLADHTRHFQTAVDDLQSHQERTGVRPLWGTANLFSHPRYAAGAATNPNPEVFAFAAAQVRQVLEATHRLGGANYVLWGGREGYDTLLNTNIGRELDQLGRFLNMVVEHKHKIGFKGTILIEPKPHEPTKHQYDFDTATVFGFLKRYGLEKEVKVNIEANHATLGGHSFEHEIAVAAAFGVLGSIDANRGDPQNGWDTDQFPNSIPELTLALFEILSAGGLGAGGFNFDAKVRRQSIEAVDLFHGHIGAMDAIARALLGAAAMMEDGRLAQCRANRYAGWDSQIGRAIEARGATLASVADLAVERQLNPKPVSGRQEYLENLVNRFC